MILLLNSDATSAHAVIFKTAPEVCAPSEGSSPDTFQCHLISQVSHVCNQFVIIYMPNVLDCMSPDRPQKPKLVSFQQGPFYWICVHAAQFDRLGGGHLAVVTQVQIWHKSERRIFLFV